MRIDAKQVESPAISWAECRRERLLFRRLVLVSVLELAALSLMVFVLIAAVPFIEGQNALAVRSLGVCAALVAIIVAAEVAFRSIKRRVAALDDLVDGDAEQTA